MDTYLEYIIKQKYTFLKVMAVISLYLGATVLSIGVFILGLMSSAVMQFFALILAGLFFGAWWLSSKLCVEYEYIVTNDELDVDRIVAKKTRRRLLTVSVKNFEEFGVATEDVVKAKRDASVKVFLDASIGKKSDNRYYAIFLNKQSQKMMLVFNPTGKMLDSFKIFNSRVCG